MSVGCVSETKIKKPTRVNFAGLFDWAADHLQLATPRNIVAVLSDVRGDELVEAFGNYIPRAHHNTFSAFQRLSYNERINEAKAWFDNIEPGHARFQEPAW